jgi:hypothetical protein
LNSGGSVPFRVNSLSLACQAADLFASGAAIPGCKVQRRETAEQFICTYSGEASVTRGRYYS